MLLAVIGLLAWVALRRPTATPVQVMTMAAPASVPAPAIAAPVAAPTAEPAVIAEAPPPPPKVVKAQPAPPSPPTAATASDAAAHSGDLAGVRDPAPGRSSPDAVAAARRRRAAPDANFQPIVVRDLRAVAVINGRSSKVVDAIVAFSEQSITASDSRNGTTVKTFAYSAVTHATVSRSRKPRGAGGAFVETPGGIPDGNIFSRGARLWVTLETADDRLVLRLDPEQLRPVLTWSGSAPRSRSSAIWTPKPSPRIAIIFPGFIRLSGIERALDRAHDLERRAVLRFEKLHLADPDAVLAACRCRPSPARAAPSAR